MVNDTKLAHQSLKIWFNFVVESQVAVWILSLRMVERKAIKTRQEK